MTGTADDVAAARASAPTVGRADFAALVARARQLAAAPTRRILDDGERLDRLIRRHMEFGRDLDAATARARGNDQRNAELIATTKVWADLFVDGS